MILTIIKKTAYEYSDNINKESFNFIEELNLRFNDKHNELLKTRNNFEEFLNVPTYNKLI